MAGPLTSSPKAGCSKSDALIGVLHTDCATETGTEKGRFGKALLAFRVPAQILSLSLIPTHGTSQAPERKGGHLCLYFLGHLCLYFLGRLCLFVIVRKQQSRTRGPWIGPDIGDPRPNIYIYILHLHVHVHIHIHIHLCIDIHLYLYLYLYLYPCLCLYQKGVSGPRYPKSKPRQTETLIKGNRNKPRPKP